MGAIPLTQPRPRRAWSAAVRVLVIEHSALVARTLRRLLDADPGIEVVGTATHPVVASRLIGQLDPDVLMLDLEMPGTGGVTFLRDLMRRRPMPVVGISALTEKTADVTFEVLRLGAVDVMSKPRAELAQTLRDYADELVQIVKVAAKTDVRTLAVRGGSFADVPPKLSADAVIGKRTSPTHIQTTNRIIAIGASTGGTEAIKYVLGRMAPDSPGTVIVQHIPQAFSAAFASRVDAVSSLRVREAEDGQQILPGHAYIAPGGMHLLVVRDGARYQCELSDGPAVNRHRPSVDVLFRSVAQNAGSNATGIILTGMGDDGARGLKEMLDAGARTLAQDESTSVVWGMPGASVKQGAVEEVLPIESIPARLRRIATA